MSRTTMPQREDPNGPYRELVCAFLRQVVHDARQGTVQDKAEARAFLHDAPAVAFWCELVGLDAAAGQAALLRAAGLQGLGDDA